MRSIKTTFLLLSFFALRPLGAQVWFPEGVYTQSAPFMITVDNQVITVAKAGIDLNNSYWQVCVNDGKSWIKLPILTLSKSAEILDVKKFQGLIYICGNFTFDNGNFNALVRFNADLKWQGLEMFRKGLSNTGSILSMDVHGGNLVLGGAFTNIGQDTINYLAKFNGLKFSEYFEGCKDCAPDFQITDICSNDSVVAFSGTFTKFMGHKSKFLARIINGKKLDTFINTPKVIEKIALLGTDVFGVGGLIRDKRVYKFNSTVTEINLNIDSAITVSEILLFDNRLVMSGVFNLGAGNKNSVLRLDAGVWKDISNNFRNITHIATGRSILMAVGNSPAPLSIWNQNRYVCRFYPGLSLVKTSVFLDSNNNCIRENHERPLSKQFIKLPFLNRGVFTNEKGFAEFLVPNGMQTTYRFVVKPFRNFVKSSCADTVINKTFYPGVYLDSMQFPLNRIPNINDIKVALSSPRGAQVVRNKKVVYYIVYENVGSNPISGTIRLRKSKLFTKEATLPVFKTQLNDSTLQWEYNNLLPGEKKLIVYTAYPEDVAFDQPIRFDAMAASSISSGTSQFADDDSDSIPQTSDPDIKAFRKDVYPSPASGDSITYLDADSRDLRYNISFNNFTNDTVFYAVVIDTLDLNLDMSYIEETGSNKSYYTEVQTDPNNQYKGILIWHFPNIRLSPNPSKDYENTGSGSYIGFKVVTKPLSNGYYLRNTASVFFDNAFAGNTNSVYCTLAISGIDDVYAKDNLFSVSPNPSGSNFEMHASFKPGDKVRVLNACGQLVYETIVYSMQEHLLLETASLPSGVYLIQMQSGYSQSTLKVVKY